MHFIVAAWAASVLYAFGSVAGKLAAKHHINNPWLYNFAWAVVTLVCTLPIALWHHVGFPQDWPSMWWLALANAVSGVMYILALYEIDVSVIGPLYNLRTPVLLLAGTLIYNEVLYPYQWIAISVLILAGLVVNIDEKLSLRSLFNKRTLLGLVAVLTSAWFNGTIKYTSQHNGYWEVLLWSTVLGIIFLLPTIPLFYKDVKKTRANRYTGLVISTVLFTVGFLFEVMAVAQNVSISMAIVSLPVSMLIAVGFSVFAPQLLEKHTAKVYALRLGAAAVMVASALVLSCELFPND